MGLTWRSPATSPGNVLRARYLPCNNREIEILPKLAHWTHSLQEKVPEKATQAREEASHRTRAACGRGVTDERALGGAPGALIAA
jgi:hypothetical protein